MKTLIISTSLNPGSRSRILAKEVLKQIPDAEFIDLRDYNLPICDGDAVYADENVIKITEKIKNADGIIIATPIYNYNVASSAKNLIELTGKVWTDKVVGFVCAAGGERSYMAPMGLANNLMFDFRCIIVPRFVYATKRAFKGETVFDENVQARIEGLTKEFLLLTKAISSVR